MQSWVLAPEELEGNEPMESVLEIEKAVSNLSPDELAQFRAWFEAFDAAVWDRQFEKDVRSGKLDQIAEKALADYAAGNCDEL
jgi:hypothetical protein